MTSIKYNLILVNLSILLFLSLLSIISGNNFLANSYVESIEYNQMLNGTISTLGYDDLTGSFSLDPLIQAIIWIAVIGGIAIASSITVVGTGLSSAGTKWIVGTTFFVSIWVMFSTLPLPLINDIGIIGSLIYLLMTMIYSIGAIWILIEAGG